LESIRYKGWEISYEELTNGGYRVIARGPNSPGFAEIGNDLAVLLDSCKKYIESQLDLGISY
jgi:hypothetical protein